MTAPTLTGLAAAVTFGENTVNATPQIIDVDVVLFDPDDDFDGGTLTLTGLLLEDTVSVNNQGTTAGQIGLNGSSVTFGGVVIGTLAGGNGTDLAITFNAAATSVAIDALIQNLTYANSSDTPTTSRDFLLNVTDASGADFDAVAGNDTFAVLTGMDNPFDSIDVSTSSTPSFFDIDGDGDLDLVIGAYSGQLYAYRNGTDGAAGAFTELTGTDNPFNGISVASVIAPSFADIDGDGDLDLVVGEFYGTLATYRNGTDGTEGAFTELTGANNPFNGIDLGFESHPTFFDIDGDGDLDLVTGSRSGTLSTYRNGTDGTAGAFTQLTGANNLFSGIDVGVDSAPRFVDLDGDEDLDLVIGNGNGTLVSYRNGTDGTEGSFTELTGSDNPFNGIDVGNESNPSFFDVDGDGDLDLVLGDGSGTLTTFENTTPQGISITINVTPEVEQLTLNSLAASVTFGENTINAAPQLIDMDVTFEAPFNNFDGGRLTLSGLIAEDTVSVRNEGTSAGQIGLNGANVTYGGVVIGTLAGGNGADLTIIFNAAATTAAIDALIQNLTYANSSDLPTASRDFLLNVSDATGADLGPVPSDSTFVELTASNNPFDGINDGYFSTPSFVDIDGDGDLDLVVGNYYGEIVTYRNGTNGTEGAFTQLTGANNPFSGVFVGYNSSPSFFDIDGDGDLDLIVGEYYGGLYTYRNGTDGTEGAFTALTGAANLFDGIDASLFSRPTFVDVDGDGDLDLVLGEYTGTLLTYRNGTDGTEGTFTQLTGTDNPFNGIDIGNRSAPSFVDIDGDGDLDLVVGEYNGQLFTFRNGTNGTEGAFTQLTGTDNPFDGVYIGAWSSPTFVDIDGDGDLDLVTGEYDGELTTFENTTPRGVGITINVTAENDAPTVSGDQSFTVLEGGIAVLTAADFVGIDIDDDDSTLTYTVSNIIAGVIQVGSVSATTFTAAQLAAGDVSFAHDGSETSTASFDVTATDDDGATSSAISITATVRPVYNAPIVSGLAASVTFAENAVNAGAQLIDTDVTLTAPDSSFDGGTLTLTGVLAEDTLSVNHQGSGTGQIGLNGANVTYGGVVIGALAGGNGTDLTITFNAAATSIAVDALIQNLTYANSSNTPTASRDLRLNIIDASGGDLDAAIGNDTFAALTGANNPFNGIDVGSSSAPSFFDIDSDGDLDLVVGEYDAELFTFRNGTNGTEGAFTQLTGTNNPFNGVVVSGSSSTPSFTDIDGDGDLDLVVGNYSGEISTYRNGTDGTAGAFTQLTGNNNPFFAITTYAYNSAPSFVDIDGDGDLDLVVGNKEGTLVTFRNGTDGIAGTFTKLSDAENPFDSIDVGDFSMPSFVDIDGDGDLDLVVGERHGTLRAYRNGTDGAVGAFTELTGANNPFQGIDVGSLSKPSFVDIDGDGDLDLVVGAYDGTLITFENTTPRGVGITINVTPEQEPPVLSGDLAASLNDGAAYVLTAADLSASDVDDATSVLVFTVSNVVNGTVLLNGAATAAFTQADIDAGRVSFRHDPAATADGSFEVTVADDDGAASAASTFTLTALGPVVQDGTSGVDDLDGGDANDYIRGLDDNDRIDGFEGNDQLFGNAGDDTLVGGNGDDILNGGNGDDRLFGGAGADFMDGRGGFDLASYKTATSGIVLDLINGANNTGDAAGDTFANIAAFEGTRFNDTMTGDANTNRMFGLDGEDTLNGGGANDRLLGGDGNDTLNGDDGADLLYGDDGDDILNGGNGRDVLVGGDGADTFNGGNDIDRVTYKPSDAGVTIDLTNAANSTGDALGDTFNSIELIEGSQFDDVFIGSSAQDRLFGLDGADQMMAGAGNDLLEGGNGNDVLDGGADADILRGGEGNDTLTGGAGKDRFQFGGNEGTDTITDFSQSELDRMQFTDASGVESMADLTIVQQGNDTLITYAQGSILLEDFTATDLTAADFNFL